MLTEFHIGIDDTDSKFGGCTTYTATLIFEKLLERKIGFSDFPWIVRLNPNIPWKTRGNGALAIHLRTDKDQVEQAKQLVITTIENTSNPDIPGTDPAAVFVEGEIPVEVEAFATKALHDVIRTSEAETLIDSTGATAWTLKGQRGIIGALAAVGYGPNRTHTFEIIAYRTKKFLGTPREVDLDSVRRMDRKFADHTFNNLDPETDRVLVCPHGHDPVLLGIRGDDPRRLLEAIQEVVIREPVERVMIFKTNHGTDAHLTLERGIREVTPYQSVIITGRVKSHPISLRGGHVVFQLQDETGSIDCAVYEPTGSLRKVALELIAGDKVRIMGGVRPGPYVSPTLNLEKLEVLELVESMTVTKPKCSACSSGCESMGRRQGFRCRKCGLRFPREMMVQALVKRKLRRGLYLPPPRAHRHLTKPISMYNAGEVRTGMKAKANSDRLETLHLEKGGLSALGA